MRVVTYMAENGYLVRGSAEELAAVGALVGADAAVRAVVPFTAADKLGAGVRTEGRQRLAVQSLSGGDGSPARSRVDDLGRELHGTSAVGPFRTQYVELDAADAAALARDPGVISIQPAPEPRLRDEVADQIVAGALSGPDPLVPTGPGYLAFYNALGLGTGTFPFVIDVTDEGIDVGSTATGQADFHEGGDVGQPEPDRVRQRLHLGSRCQGLRRPRHDQRVDHRGVQRRHRRDGGGREPASTTAWAWRRARSSAPRRSSCAPAGTSA